MENFLARRFELAVVILLMTSVCAELSPVRYISVFAVSEELPGADVVVTGASVSAVVPGGRVVVSGGGAAAVVVSDGGAAVVVVSGGGAAVVSAGAGSVTAGEVLCSVAEVSDGWDVISPPEIPSVPEALPTAACPPAFTDSGSTG